MVKKLSGSVEEYLNMMGLLADKHCHFLHILVLGQLSVLAKSRLPHKPVLEVSELYFTFHYCHDQSQ